MKVVISSNESRAVQDAIRAAIPDVESRPLVDGDIAILREDNEPVCLIERKTWSDLLASLGNRHLQDQLARMRAACACNILIIENANLPPFQAAPGRGVSAKFAHAYLLDVQRDGVFVMWVQTTADLGHVCAWLHKRACEGRLAPAAAGGGAAACGPADPIARTPRARNADAAGVRAAMLACIPGISIKKANELLRHIDIRIPLPETSPVKGIGSVLWKRIRDVLHVSAGASLL